MAKLMRCKEPHWQGDKFVPLGALRPEGHPDVNGYFELYVEDQPPEPKPRTRRAS